MTTIINGDSPSITFSDATTQASALPAYGSSGNVLTSTGSAWASSSAPALTTKTVQVTRDMSLASGTQAITGAGFRLTSAIVLSSVQSTNRMSSTVIDSSGTARGVKDDSANVPNNWTNINSVSDMGSGNEQIAAWSSYDADGMTISWTKYGSPTGTCYLNILFMK